VYDLITYLLFFLVGGWPEILAESRNGRNPVPGTSISAPLLLKFRPCKPYTDVSSPQSSTILRPNTMDKKIGVLGGGQLGRMFIESANRLNIPVNVLDAENAPATHIGHHPNAQHVAGSFKDRAAIVQLAERSDVLTAEIEHIDAEALEELAADKVQPHPTTFQIIQDKFRQKQHLGQHGIPTAESLELARADAAALKEMGTKLGYPFMLKTRRNAYDGRGNFPVRSEADVSEAVNALGQASGGLYAEKWAPFKKELAVMAVKTVKGTFGFPTVETEHENSICKLVWAPARGVSPTTARRAQELAEKAVSTFKGLGIFGVEMFLLDDDEETLLINEIAPRPHNSGHYTQDACHLNQFDAHLRAILGLPLPVSSLQMKEPAAIMLNLLGAEDPNALNRVISLALETTNANVHLYGKAEARKGRKMGHINVTASTMAAAEAIMAPLIEAVDLASGKLAKSSKPALPAASSLPTPPLVGVITGSISDQPKLEGCYKILDDFGIPYEKGIKSAHRTPVAMAQYAQEARDRGIKVIIAAAGGAAHLPGMHWLIPPVPSPTQGESARH
jgi:phosphoribosylaminoimidazole carboxylase